MMYPSSSQDARPITRDHQQPQQLHQTKDPAAQAVLGEFDRLCLRERWVPHDSLDSGDRSDAAAISGEEHVASMEKDLFDDAPWKRIQRNTFTRWVNERLKAGNESVVCLQTDLSDGLRLITLIEVLSGKRFYKYNKRPSFRSQKLENVSLALTFLEEEEGIKLVSIDSADIVDGRLKLILGLIWALILHYSISLPKWDDEDTSAAKEKMTPKERLLSWFSNKLPVPIRNFTTDWSDGRACGALDNSILPGLCPDWERWDPLNAVSNVTEAMSLAERYLGVPQLFKPEEMGLDEQSMICYLSQFPVAKANPCAPLRTKSYEYLNMAEEFPYSAVPLPCSSPTPLKPCGSQVVESCTENSEITEEGATIVTRRETRVNITSQVVTSSSHHVFSSQDTGATIFGDNNPSMEISHTMFNNVPEVPDGGLEDASVSHDVRSLAGIRCDASKVVACGAGLEIAVCNKPNTFIVKADAAGYNMILVGIYGKILHAHEVEVKHLGYANYQVTYILAERGEYLLSVKYGDVHIPGSPFVISCI